MQHPKKVREIKERLIGKHRKLERSLNSVFDYMNGPGKPEEIIHVIVHETVYDLTGEFLSGIAYLPPILVPDIVAALAHAFGAEGTLSLVVETQKAYEHARGREIKMNLLNDLPLLSALFRLPADGNDVFIHDRYIATLVGFLKLAIERRYFKDSPANPFEVSVLSSAVKELFESPWTSPEYNAQIVRAAAILVGGEGNFFPPGSEATLEAVLFKEVFFKSFNSYSTEDKGRILLDWSNTDRVLCPK